MSGGESARAKSPSPQGTFHYDCHSRATLASLEQDRVTTLGPQAKIVLEGEGRLLDTGLGNQVEQTVHTCEPINPRVGPNEIASRGTLVQEFAQRMLGEDDWQRARGGSVLHDSSTTKAESSEANADT